MYLDAILSTIQGSNFIKPKPIILIELLKISIKHYFIYNFLKREASKERIFGLKVETGDYEIFLRLFIDIFIKNQYYFVAETEKPNIIDAGAHIGLASLYFKLLYPKSKVTCFEPDPENFSVLKKNIAENLIEEVTLYNFALSDREGSLTFATAEPREKWGSRVVNFNSAHNAERVRVDAKKLSSFLPGRTDLLKLDIEGSESVVLQELDESGMLNRIDLIILEYHWSRRIKHRNGLSKIFTVLERNNFFYYVAYFFRSPWYTHTPFSTLRYLSHSSNFLIYAKRIKE